MNEPAHFRLVADFEPSGDQPKAIAALLEGVRAGRRDQVLLGVTGSGKTYTMAQIIQSMGVPALILAHNKTLAGQLFGEMKAFFPDNAVEYFVSYYDYYQPEAYVPRTDTFIEKDSSVNEQIDRMRHSATKALLTRRDAVIVASVSCIYGLGSPEEYLGMSFTLTTGQEISQHRLLRKLVEIQYRRNDIDFQRGTFRVKGDTLEVFPADEESVSIRIELFGDEIERISLSDPLTGRRLGERASYTFFPASHYVTRREGVVRAIEGIKAELVERLAWFRQENRLVEAQRLESRTLHDLEMFQELGYCTGVENYSRHLSGRAPGEPPPTLLEYLPKDALLFVDESHVTLPQVRGMFKGDRSRKQTLVEYGFRLPSAIDNRPLTFDEWDQMRSRTIYVSATPALLELERSQGYVVEQIIRPTGLLDPICEIRPVEHQVDDLMAEIQKTVAKGYRVLATTLTKRMAEDLTEYLKDAGLKVSYLHSDVETLERMEIVRNLRLGIFDVLVGINLLREGLDIPETGLVAILDADKEGFLRSDTALVQTMGRAARNLDGKVILYADRMTGSMERALAITNSRRARQEAYNQEHGITPISVKKEVADLLGGVLNNDQSYQEQRPGYQKVAEPQADYGKLTTKKELNVEIRRVERAMRAAAERMAFEEAAQLRDRLIALEKEALLKG